MFGIIIFAFLLSATTVPVNGEPSATQIKEIIDVLYKLVVDGKYDVAVNVSIVIAGAPGADKILPETVKKLLESRSIANANVLSYAYKLWKTAEDIVIEYFPLAITNLLNKTVLKIVNKKYELPLKLSVRPDQVGDRQAFGDGTGTGDRRLSFLFIPMWKDNEVIFKIKYREPKAFLKLAKEPDSDGYRLAVGSETSNTDAHKFHLEAQIEGDELVFFIINFMYCQGLELSDKANSIGDRKVRAHEEDICPDMDSFKWFIIKL